MRTLTISAVRAATIGIAVLVASMSIGSTAAAAEQDDEVIGGIGLRLTEAPVSAGDDPRARLYIVDHLAPGTTIERGIEISNSTGSAQNVTLYAAAASIDDGTFVGAAADTQNELSSWTSVTPGVMEVPGNGALTATVTVAVPADAAPGEQYGVIWAEARSEPAEGGGVVQVSRVGIRMYVSVGPGGAPAADFAIDSVTASRSEAEGVPMISASVHNTGGRALDLSGTLSLSNGPGGLNAGPFTVELGRTLAIDDVQSVQVMLDDQLPAGPWDATITLASGLTERTVDATITFPEQGTAAPVDVQTPDTTPLWPVISVAGAVALVLLAACGIYFAIRRRRRVRPAVGGWAPPSGPPAGAEQPVSSGMHR